MASFGLDGTGLDFEVPSNGTIAAMAEALRRFRDDNRLSLDEMSRRSGLSKSSLWRIEHGQQALTERTIRKLMKATSGTLTANDFIDPEPADPTSAAQSTHAKRCS